MADTPIDMDIDFGDIERKREAAVDLSIGPVKEKLKPILLIIRHGNTFEKDEPPRRIGGKTDLQLTAEGRQQIARLRVYLEKFKLLPQRLFASPLQRTMQSAKIISTSFEVLEFLREIYHGMDENKTEDIVLKNVGKAALEAWDREGKLPPGWTADILGIRQGWQGLKKLCRDNGGIWAAVTSNGVARFVFEDVDGIPENRKLSTGAFGMLVYDEETKRWNCQGWNLKP